MRLRSMVISICRNLMLGRNLSLYQNILLHQHIKVFYHSDIAISDDWKQLRNVVIVLTVTLFTLLTFFSSPLRILLRVIHFILIRFLLPTPSTIQFSISSFLSTFFPLFLHLLPFFPSVHPLFLLTSPPPFPPSIFYLPNFTLLTLKRLPSSALPLYRCFKQYFLFAPNSFDSREFGPLCFRVVCTP